MRDGLARLAVGSARATDRLLRAARGVHDGVWLGLLDDDMLDRVDAAYYGGSEQWVDDDHNTRGLLDWEQAFVDDHLEVPSRVLVHGAGGGREVLALRALGHDATGTEPNPGLVAYGNDLLQREGHPPVLHTVPRAGLEGAPDGPFDAVVVGWGAYTHVRGRARRLALLAELRARLVPGGMLLVSYYDVSGRSTYLTWTARVGKRLRRVAGRPDVELGDAFAAAYVHYFRASEVRRELQAMGFTVERQRAQPYAHTVGRLAPTSGGDRGTGTPGDAS